MSAHLNICINESAGELAYVPIYKVTDETVVWRSNSSTSDVNLALRVALALPVLDVRIEDEGHVGAEHDINQVSKCDEYECGELKAMNGSQD